MRSVRLELFQVRAIVLADAQELLGVADRRQPCDFGLRERDAARQLGLALARRFEYLANTAEAGGAEREQLAHRRRQRGPAGFQLLRDGEVENALAEHGAEAGRGGGGARNESQ